MKVAKTVSNELVALDSSELTQFQAYINDVKPAGIKVTASSLNADEFRPVLTIKYDPILDPVDVRAGVEDAIRAWLDAVPFDAKYTRLALEDAIQAVPGVVGIIITILTSYSGLVPYVWTQEHTALAGYMVYDDQNSTITLTPA